MGFSAKSFISLPSVPLLRPLTHVKILYSMINNLKLLQYQTVENLSGGCYGATNCKYRSQYNIYSHFINLIVK